MLIIDVHVNRVTWLRCVCEKQTNTETSLDCRRRWLPTGAIGRKVDHVEAKTISFLFSHLSLKLFCGRCFIAFPPPHNHIHHSSIQSASDWHVVFSLINLCDTERQPDLMEVLLLLLVSEILSTHRLMVRSADVPEQLTVCRLQRYSLCWQGMCWTPVDTTCIWASCPN